jgi:hypothetical protein
MATPIYRSLLDRAALAAIAAMGTFAVMTGGATPAEAQGAAAAYYQAQLVSPVPAARTEIVGGVAWRCAGDSCVAAKGTSRPEVVCARLARKVGTVSGFSVAGEPLEAGRLAKCNPAGTAAELTRREEKSPARP